MKNEKQDHMALVAIVGIVAIVGLFLMFFNSSSVRVATTDETETDLSGQAIKGLTANIEENLDNEYPDYIVYTTACMGWAGNTQGGFDICNGFYCEQWPENCQ